MKFLNYLENNVEVPAYVGYLIATGFLTWLTYFLKVISDWSWKIVAIYYGAVIFVFGLVLLVALSMV